MGSRRQPGLIRRAMSPVPYAPLPFANITPNAPTAQGIIHVFLPTANAIVLLNGQKIRGTGKESKLTTPVLPGNREFQYWVTATFNRGGQTVTEYRKVDVGAGEYTVADFTIPPEPNPIKLPAGPVDPNSVVPDTTALSAILSCRVGRRSEPHTNELKD